MNVLYLPRLEKKDNNVTLLDPVKGFSVENVNMFPCSGGNYINGQTRKSGTSCCLRDFQSLYRPSAAFTDFLQHDASFNSEATTTTCGKDSFGQHESPNSQVVYNQQRADGTTNDMVVGDIEGLPYSTVELVETVDYSKRIFKVRLLLEEGDLRKHAAAVKGALNAEYTLTFFVGLANFQPVADTAPGLYTSMLQSRSMQQRVVVTKSNVLTVSTFGANQVTPIVSAFDNAYSANLLCDRTRSWASPHCNWSASGSQTTSSLCASPTCLCPPSRCPAVSPGRRMGAALCRSGASRWSSRTALPPPRTPTGSRRVLALA